MRIVLDTNVVVSGLLSSNGKPADVLSLVRSGALIVCYDARILAEYREVLARPRFAGRIDASRAAAVLAAITAHGVDVGAVNTAPFGLPDPDDQPFLDVAIAGTATAIVTGNMRHFPAGCGVAIVNPAGLVAMLPPAP